MAVPPLAIASSTVRFRLGDELLLAPARRWQLIRTRYRNLSTDCQEATGRSGRFWQRRLQIFIAIPGTFER